ncbi:MAG: hypothetical protein H6576_09255 [Lewinellaceae bacterium]|nr:hypothetical protein [Saprospiraceae bacterium]MCB9343872.1 hypothetical protein [Lewinellaceae bacterium]
MKKHHQRLRLSSFVFLQLGMAIFLFVLILSSCFEPREGCLDIAAVNFNASADKDCCCRYPSLVLSVEQMYDTLLFRQDSVYVGTNGELFRIKKILFYLSDFQLIKAGELYQVSDTVHLQSYGSTLQDTIEETFRDDVLLVRRTPVDYTIGSLREDGYFETFKCRLGLSEDLGKVIPDLAPDNHPLSIQSEDLYQNQYAFMEVIVVRDTSVSTLADTLRFDRSDIGDFYIEGNGSFLHNTGYDFPMTLNADWSKLFDGINWSTHDINAWKSTIVANLPSVFTVSQ